ncbi:MAG: segregation/condensation protein A [Deltaproteobacteria bacterium]|jgi:segregation and condensation protein A|nr:segregation/condensation protein A [Deltaproteobacteria bacterium]
MSEDLNLNLDIYQGPLALLLHLIKKNEVSVHDIPVSLITAQYLRYIELMEDLDLDAAGDFLIMAATLTQIKSKMLLPREEDSEGNIATDPRLEIVKPLLEYSAYQAASEALSERPLLERDVFVRGLPAAVVLPESADSKAGPPEISATLFDLLNAWRDIAGRKVFEETTLSFTMETKTISEKIEEIRGVLLELKSAHFRDLALRSKNTLELALSFLAVLELARTGFLRLYQDIDADRSGPGLFLADPRAAVAEIEVLDYR